MPDAADPRANRWFMYALIVGLGVLSFLIFAPFASFIIMGLFLAYAAHPIYRRLLPALGGLRRTTSGIVLLLVFVIVVGPLVWVAFALVADVSAFAATLQPAQVEAFLEQVLASMYALVGEEPPEPGFSAQLIASIIPAIRAFLTARLSDFFAFFARLFVGLFLMAFVIFYALKDGEDLVAYVKDVTPLTHRQGNELLGEVGRTVDAVFFGQIVGSIIQGAIGGLGFVLFGVPNPVLWGTVMIVLAIIPVIGAFLIWAPAAAILFLLGDTFNAVGLFLWGAIIVSQVDNLVKPLLIGSRAQIHPVIVLVGVVGGLAVFGFIGFILGPLVLGMFLAVLKFWREDYLPMYVDRAGAPAEVEAEDA